ncbi:hypothetical protein LX15_006409 [Streptoalloteichus tenebrarius]|uniref:Uncharacterized protein n=1 Tax=Streptoalloteichus tenebrarius (strain ATCC 17920 / DSM 40477 / JCM 4838 / CBS 697.72 / NBRC 16177 / NCIMB 11028 / NRRL B-12390 / A12253. 1 / ISP 5477) TaxID=1933 RepID=A0ABT1I4H9_STRSD|nr:hypothetical protein [Streptoalloteichus tenebrarius]MCP2262667.1 hypothetical protein [Streptoalloteichus tenebrarius]BFF03109.1 hypothetical protein GCM10020241_47840 [Streptoalloteichus tenebrarius]
MTDNAVSLVRTLVPSLWGTVVAWLVGVGLLPGDLADDARGLATTFLVPVAISGVYAGFRWLETRSWIPVWLSRLLLGSTRQPTYVSSR